MITATKIWEDIIESLEDNKMILSTEAKEVEVINFENEILYLNVDSYDAHIELYNIKDEIIKIARDKYKIFFPNFSIELKKTYSSDDNKGEIKKNEFKTNLNPNFKLENYIVGDNNLYAYSAALKLIEGETKRFSPLFIYGDPGLGKTHLAQAIGNECLKKDPSKKIIYTDANEFSNDLVKSFSDKTTINFKDKFKNLDMLIIDDVQFFEKMFGKGDDKIQKEFFDVFNIMHLNNKPIVIMSDKHAKDLKNVEQRLISRLDSGFSCELSFPDKSVRMSTIKKLAEESNLELDDDLVSYIADELETTFREINGFINNISGKMMLFPGMQVNKKIIDEELAKRIRKKQEKITAEKIIMVVCDYYDVDKEEVLGKKRNKDLVRIRDVLRELLHRLLDLSLTSIGEMFSSDHTAVIKAIKKIENLKKTDPNDKIFDEIRELTNKLKN